MLNIRKSLTFGDFVSQTCAFTDNVRYIDVLYPPCPLWTRYQIRVLDVRGHKWDRVITSCLVVWSYWKFMNYYHTPYNWEQLKLRMHNTSSIIVPRFSVKWSKWHGVSIAIHVNIVFPSNTPLLDEYCSSNVLVNVINTAFSKWRTLPMGKSPTLLSHKNQMRAFW